MAGVVVRDDQHLVPFQSEGRQTVLCGPAHLPTTRCLVGGPAERQVGRRLLEPPAPRLHSGGALERRGRDRSGHHDPSYPIRSGGRKTRVSVHSTRSSSTSPDSRPDSGSPWRRYAAEPRIEPLEQGSAGEPTGRRIACLEAGSQVFSEGGVVEQAPDEPVPQTAETARRGVLECGSIRQAITMDVAVLPVGIGHNERLVPGHPDRLRTLSHCPAHFLATGPLVGCQLSMRWATGFWSRRPPGTRRRWRRS